ncbi:hypothetical protein [Peribacillus glennii]|uniref:PH domain-containing protein n=1 Tax=Peribacillus glennii TaxID=2303991 RepID=A0A372L797_9BACI|nr:hypothetical protein [Peribacillus glennii]RFU61098.1 hypothetical protein D0466_19125 [Peribacillus glennii]
MKKDVFNNQVSKKLAYVISAIGPILIFIMLEDLFDFHLAVAAIISLVFYGLIISIINYGYLEKIVIQDGRIIYYLQGKQTIPVKDIEHMYFVVNLSSAIGEEEMDEGFVNQTPEKKTRSLVIRTKEGQKLTLNAANFGKSFQEIIDVLKEINPSIKMSKPQKR